MFTLKNILKLSVIGFVVLFTFSCEDEPYTGPIPTTNNPNSTIQATYVLTAVNTSILTELNGNGAPSSNQMNETACYNNSTIVLNVNGTFKSDQKGVKINTTITPNTIDCFTDPIITGTWEIENNNLILTYTENSVPVVEIFIMEGNSVKLNIPSADVVSLVAGVPTELQSDVQLIYTKL